MFFFRIYQFLIAFPLLLVLTTLTAVVTIVGSTLFGGRWWGYWPACIWSKLFCWLSFVSVEVRGRENIDRHTSYVFVANHQGSYDIFAIYGFLGHNFKWMMKKSLEKIPLVGYSCKRAGHIMVDKSSPAAVRATMQCAERQLRDGMSLVVFPEGSRTLDGKMHRFKKGAFQLSLEFGLPLVPLTIDGSYHVLRRTATLPRPGRIILTIHKPIPAPVDEADRQRAIDASFEAVSSALPQARK